MTARILAFALAIPVVLLPLRAQVWLGTLVGLLLRVALRRRREVVIANLEIAFPEFDAAGREDLLRRHFRHLGCSVVDMLQQPCFRWRPLMWRKIRPVDWDVLRRAREGGRPVTILASHFGSWEACGSLATEPGFELLGVYKPAKGLLNAMLMEIRLGFPLVLIPKAIAKRELIRGMRRGAGLGLVSDQGGLTEYDFFGRPARFPSGAAWYWAKHDVTPVGVMGVRHEDGTYSCHCFLLDLPPRDQVPEADRKRVFVETYIAALEDWIRRYPEQYYWVHDIWRTYKHD